jgi:hypothetical protein
MFFQYGICHEVINIFSTERFVPGGGGGLTIGKCVTVTVGRFAAFTVERL